MAHQRAYHAAADGKLRDSKLRTAGYALNALRRLHIAAAVLFGLCAWPGAPAHAQSGPFAGMAGTWSGSGTVTLEDGSAERIRCRAHYAVSGPRMNMTLLCASESYKFDLQGSVAAEGGGAIAGSWSESSRGINGSLQGRGGNGNFQVVASAQGFNAQISLTTRGNRQSVVIRGEGQFRSASISLVR